MTVSTCGPPTTTTPGTWRPALTAVWPSASERGGAPSRLSQGGPAYSGFLLCPSEGVVGARRGSFSMRHCLGEGSGLWVCRGSLSSLSPGEPQTQPTSQPTLGSGSPGPGSLAVPRQGRDPLGADIV